MERLGVGYDFDVNRLGGKESTATKTFLKALHYIFRQE
jgi:hypothetical protein